MRWGRPGRKTVGDEQCSSPASHKTLTAAVEEEIRAGHRSRDRWIRKTTPQQGGLRLERWRLGRRRINNQPAVARQAVKSLHSRPALAGGPRQAALHALPWAAVQTSPMLPPRLCLLCRTLRELPAMALGWEAPPATSCRSSSSRARHHSSSSSSSGSGSSPGSGGCPAWWTTWLACCPSP